MQMQRFGTSPTNHQALLDGFANSLTAEGPEQAEVGQLVTRLVMLGLAGFNQVPLKLLLPLRENQQAKWEECVVKVCTHSAETCGEGMYALYREVDLLLQHVIRCEKRVCLVIKHHGLFLHMRAQELLHVKRSGAGSYACS